MRRLLAVLALASALAWPSSSYAAGAVNCRLTDARITEASTLVDFGDLLVISNDSGDSARVFAVDPRTCDTVGVTTYAGPAVDVESMAPAGGRDVWVGDTGDNLEQRRDITVTRLPIDRGDHHVSGQRYRLHYPDGPHDAESLAVVRGRLVIVTKAVLGGGVYVAPPKLSVGRPTRLRLIGHVDTWATDAAASHDGRWLLVRGYADATLFAYPSLRAVARFELPAQPQGEGISIGPGGRVLVDSEGVHSVLRQVRPPAAVTRALTPAPRSVPSSSPSKQRPATPRPAPASQPAAGDSGSPTWVPWAVGGGVVLAGVVLLSGRRAR